ncbi:MAG: hypothetical protein M3Q07_03035 [Pseudobdellovibrionaceae bacterium]|nr:hypothetical protein [Pseudobdellovibrionaceae bacterium]
MTEHEADILLIELEHYRRLWKTLEDLETLLWSIKDLNDEMGSTTTSSR